VKTAPTEILTGVAGTKQVRIPNSKFVTLEQQKLIPTTYSLPLSMGKGQGEGGHSKVWSPLDSILSLGGERRFLDV
jgi:hypothetical protein